MHRFGRRWSSFLSRLTISRSIEGDPKEFCKTNWGDGMKKPYPLQLDDCLHICGCSPSTNQAGGCGKILCHLLLLLLCATNGPLTLPLNHVKWLRFLMSAT